MAPAHRSDPEAGRLRVLPMTDSAARFWHLRLGLFIGWFAFGYVTVTLLGILGLFPDGYREALSQGWPLLFDRVRRRVERT